jgi:hypothetical protein
MHGGRRSSRSSRLPTGARARLSVTRCRLPSDNTADAHSRGSLGTEQSADTVGSPYGESAPAELGNERRQRRQGSVHDLANAAVNVYPARARRQMVATQIAARGVTDPAVLAAIRTVPREAFVNPELLEFAYDDIPLPIGAGQTISQPLWSPYAEHMTQAAHTRAALMPSACARSRSRGPVTASGTHGHLCHACRASASAVQRHGLASLARGNRLFLRVIWFPKPGHYFCNEALSWAEAG